MGINNSQNCVAGTELSAAMTGSTVLIGTLPQSPVIMIFDNQGTASVAIYVNGTAAGNLWRTFTPGEALVLDLRAASGVAPNFTFPGNTVTITKSDGSTVTETVGTTFYGNGASGTFSISYVYAQNM